MQYDMDLCRAILLKIGDSDSEYVRLNPNDFPEHPAESVPEHIRLLLDAGLILIEGTPSYQRPVKCPASVLLTWHGYEFLDLARDDMRWRKARVDVLRLAVLQPKLNALVRNL